MYVLDYLIYHLRPYGIVKNAQTLPEKLSVKDIIENNKKTIKESTSSDTKDLPKDSTS